MINSFVVLSIFCKVNLWPKVVQAISNCHKKEKKMTLGKTYVSAKLALATSSLTSDHRNSVEVSVSSTKRKTPNTLTKTPSPSNKVTVSQNKDAHSSLVEAINNLTNRTDDFGVQLRGDNGGQYLQVR